MTIEQLLPYLPYALMALAAVLFLLGLYLNGQLDKFAHEAVGAVYRVALNEASILGKEGLAWLQSPDGIFYRKALAAGAYDALPARIGPVPVGLVKLVISREQWCALVEQAFNEMVKVAERLEPHAV